MKDIESRNQNEKVDLLYHDTWKLLSKYRDVVWSLELSEKQVRKKFQIEYGILFLHYIFYGCPFFFFSLYDFIYLHWSLV